MYPTFQAIVVICLLAGLQGGCGGRSTSAQPPGGSSASASAPDTATTPDQVHRAWVEAMKASNRDALLTLAADLEYKTAFVDDNLKLLPGRSSRSSARTSRRAIRSLSREGFRRAAGRMRKGRSTIAPR